MMSVTTYEATVENGQIKLLHSLQLPEKTRVYVVVPDVVVQSPILIASPRLTHPEQAIHFVKEVIEEAEVPMLIDSGAAVTLLPTPSIELLGIAANVNAAYELTGFDGSTSSSLAVRADLIFQRKTFKGEFLLVNQEGWIPRT